MNLGQLRQLIRAETPGAKTQVIDDATLNLYINEAAIDVTARSLCLKGNKKFNVIANQSEYSLSAVLGDYLVPDKSGLWWNNGAQYIPLFARTLKYMDENRVNWRDLSAANPYEYFIEADTLRVVPAGDTDLTNGFWFYYVKKPAAMTADSHYPFSGSTTEFTHLSIFDAAIRKYVKWCIAPILNKDQDANLSYQEYLKEVNDKTNVFYKRPDISSDRNLKLRFNA